MLSEEINSWNLLSKKKKKNIESHNHYLLWGKIQWPAFKCILWDTALNSHHNSGWFFFFSIWNNKYMNIQSIWTIQKATWTIYWYTKQKMHMLQVVIRSAIKHERPWNTSLNHHTSPSRENRYPPSGSWAYIPGHTKRHLCEPRSKIWDFMASIWNRWHEIKATAIVHDCNITWPRKNQCGQCKNTSEWECQGGNRNKSMFK